RGTEKKAFHRLHIVLQKFRDPQGRTGSVSAEPDKFPPFPPSSLRRTEQATRGEPLRRVETINHRPTRRNHFRHGTASFGQGCCRGATAVEASSRQPLKIPLISTGSGLPEERGSCAVLWMTAL